jgi:hypothetical protein
MADIPVISVKDRLLDFNTYKKYAVYLLLTVLLLLLFRGLWSLIFKPQTQVNKPITVVTPFAKVEKGGIDQSNTQIKVDGEKNWEISGGGFGGRFDGKDFYGIIGQVKRRF